MFVKIKRKSLAIIVFLLGFNAVNAQFDINEFENIQTLKKIPLLVVMEAPNKKIVKKLEQKSQEELKRYLTRIEGKNAAIKAAIKKEWKISKDIRFIDEETLKSFKTPENREKYAYFTSDVYNKVKWKKSETGYLAYTNYSIHIIGKVTPIASKRYSFEYIPETIISKKNVALALNDIQGQFEYKEMKVAKRTAKRATKENTRLAKNTFSEDEN